MGWIDSELVLVSLAAMLSPTTLTFTTGNWDTAQTVTVTGQDDELIDGPITLRDAGGR